MTTAPLFPSFDGLLSLSRHEGVDIRPTLLRVITDLYVQAPNHSSGEKRQFAELVLGLIDSVDDATRAAVRAKLLLCPDTPEGVCTKLDIGAADPARAISDRPIVEDASSGEPLRPALPPTRSKLVLRPSDAAEIDRLFLAAGSSERILILQSLAESPLGPAVRPGPHRAARASEALEMAAFASDPESFAFELSNVLLLPAKAARFIVDDPGGEPLACACKAIGMDETVFQRVLLFLKMEIGTSVLQVFRLARLYAGLSDRAALIMVAVWRGASLAKVTARYRAALYDDERRTARPAIATSARPDVAAWPTLARGKIGQSGA